MSWICGAHNLVLHASNLLIVIERLRLTYLIAGVHKACGLSCSIAYATLQNQQCMIGGNGVTTTKTSLDLESYLQAKYG